MAGCGCGKRATLPGNKAAAEKAPRTAAAPKRERRSGMPGEPGFTWNGPQRKQ